MLRFDEFLAGGFAGLGRRYGATARFEYESARDFDAGWQQALCETAAWRARRAERARALNLNFLVPPYLAWEAILFITPRVVVPPSSLPKELRGLWLEVAVFGMPDMEPFMGLILYPEATSKDWPAAEPLDYP